MTRQCTATPGNGMRCIPVAAVACALALAALSAPLLAVSHPLAALLLRDFFSGVCHQNPGRSFIVDGSPAAVCVRCLGIYCGAALGAGLSLFLDRGSGAAAFPARRLFVSALLLNALDVATETFHIHGNLPLPRFLAGALLGVSIGVLFCVRTRLPGRLARG